jgi:hypothetical protein
MADLDFSRLGVMTEEEERQFMAAFTRELEADGDEEAQRHLKAGRPIYYADDRFHDVLVKEFPDGSRHLVTFEDDTEIFIQNL